jgi:hypothetical protein
MDFNNLTTEQIEAIKLLIQFKGTYTENQKTYFDKYIQSEKGKIKRKEINKRYYEKKKAKQQHIKEQILENQHEEIVASLEN